MSPRVDPKLSVTGIGLVGALGTRAANVLAAARCNLARTSPSTELRIPDEDSLTEKPVPVHAVRDLAAGYEHQGRWLRLLAAALQDLAPGLDAADPTPIPLVVVQPADDGDRYPVEPPAAPLGELIGHELGTHGIALACQVVPGGAATIGQALDLAAGLLQRHRRVILAGVDSLVDHCSLSWLLRADRLKQDDQPVGIAPGESAVCLLLESPAATRSGERTKAAIANWSSTSAVAAEAEAEPERWGQLLAQAINRSLSSAGAPVSAATPWHLVTNHDGDPTMARIYGGLLAALDPRLGAPQLHHPAVSFGSVGCAGAFVGMAVAAHVLATDAASHELVVTAAGLRGESAFVRLHRP
ncbi:MAG: hypothetical protein JNL08_09140 [Planctomycetes bacterium]|nr:hypothetical protein [Planctomycetota bacterium]